MKKSLFITLEGGEGTGKSTQAKSLSEKLKILGHEVVLTREPGGTPQGEALRALLVQGAVEQWTPEAEAMLNSAARAVHVRDVIRPALATGHIVISDRFMDSTRAYQCYAGGCATELINQLEHAAVGKTVPDLTLIFDLDPDLGLARAKARGQGVEDRFERKGLAFHQTLRNGFLTIATQNPDRCVVIDASGEPTQVFAACWSAIEAKLHD
jgi:dTMP kinase